jgi:para-nitrobenzyl esterase
VHPFDPPAPAQSASVPFLTGTTATETTFFATDDQLMPIDAATLRQRVKALLKVDDAEADRMIALYRKNQPGRENIDLFLRMDTDNSRFRLAVDTQAERKAEQRAAPVYLYRFEYYSPVRQGRLKSMHCMEIPFVFDNLEAGKVYTGSSPAAQRIADRIPQWPAFDGTRRATMVFGDEATVVNDPGGEERLALKAIRDRQATTKTA